jgi:hypothetical protein
MGLVNLWTPGSDWSNFWFNNWKGHQDIVQAIATQKNIQLTMYDIDPWVDSDSESILERHQDYHDEMNQALGLPGQDLSKLDLNDPQLVQAWVWQHFNEHQAAAVALKL